MTLKLPPPSYARRGGEIIAQQLKAVGVDAQIIPVEWAQWLSDVFKNKDYDLTIVSHTEPADYGIYARDDYYFDYHSDAFKKLMDELNLATDPAKRMRADRRYPEEDRRRCGERVPVRTGQDRRVEREDQGPVGELADPGQRPDQGLLGRIEGHGRGRRRGAAGPGP